MDGPVVQAARKALETGEVNLVLIWVQKQDESNIKEALQKRSFAEGFGSTEIKRGSQGTG
jgi:hypothetical protein